MIPWVVIGLLAFVTVGGTFAGLSMATDRHRDGIVRWAGAIVTLLSLYGVFLVVQLAYAIATAVS